MNIVKQRYQATVGYHDLQPGMTQLDIEVSRKEMPDGSFQLIAYPNKVSANFNEIHVDGDRELREEFLLHPDTDGKILFKDDPDYDRKKLRRSFMSTKDLSLDKDDDFVRRWAAMSYLTEDGLEFGSVHGRGHPHDGGTWGGINSLPLKKQMLDYIGNMDEQTRTDLKAVHGNPQFVADFLVWRNSLPAGERIQFVDLV